MVDLMVVLWVVVLVLWMVVMKVVELVDVMAASLVHDLDVALVVA